MKSTNLRVGVFVFASLVIGIGIVFTLGQKRSIFSRHTSFVAYFSNVDGLQEGSSVRIAGVDVGSVDDVILAADGRTRVALSINSEHAPLINSSSVAEIGSKGLLGDKLLAVSIAAGPKLIGTELRAKEPPPSISTLTGDASDVLADVKKTAASLRVLSAALSTPEFTGDIQAATKNLATALDLLAHGDGVVPRLLSDRELADRIEASIAEMQTAATEFSATARSVRGIVREVETGDGSLHKVIYGDSTEKLVSNLADASGELATLMREARTGDGAIHALLYDEAGDDLLTNLAAASADLRAVTADVRAGKGTVGAFLMDPSVYEDVKRLVGDLERNEILRALVRYSIRHREGAED